MKFNKWTLGLAALGVVSLASAASAEEKQNFLQTALSSTTISGYVDTSVDWQLKSDHNPPDFDSYGNIPYRGGSKTDGFNVNVVKLTIEKPLDEAEWASGFKVDLLFGPDAVGYNLSENAGYNDPEDDEYFSDFGIKQAYVALRAPFGNGLEFKIGTFDTIIGYEVFEAGNNPNFSRSWGYSVEPTQHTGILAAYRVNDVVSLSAGVANTATSGINERDTHSGSGSYWNKAWMGSFALTAPESWGWAKGSSFYGGVVYGFGDVTRTEPGDSSGPTDNQFNVYAGLTLNTPVAGLKAGLAYDHVENLRGGPDNNDGYTDDADILGIYASYQATEKLSLHARGEIGWLVSTPDGSPTDYDENIFALTGTVQYDLWQNVVSRLEVRWDKLDNDYGSEYEEDSIGVYANIIYKF